MSTRMNLFRSFNKAFSLAATRGFVSKRYTEYHEWISVDNNVGTVGISNYAQDSLGDLVVVELPQVGSEVSLDENVGAVESAKAACDIYSPVSGNITQVNKTLVDNPTLINKSPEDKGWIYKIQMAEDTEATILMTEEDYQKFCASKTEET
ncbi:glycine cleavage system H protein [Chlamydoabsidia padenii]|nr:glycine cleavage system H protein [Chlamydoabsidia padenii]